MATRLLLFLLAVLMAGASEAAPTVLRDSRAPSELRYIVTFDATTTASDLMGVRGLCVATFVRAGSETVTLYQTTASTATGGTSIATFSATTTSPTSLTIGQPNLYAVSDGATAGGSLTVHCSPLQVSSSGGGGWEDAGTAIVALDGHDVIVGGDEDQTCETGEICFDEGTGVVTAEGFVARDQASGSNFNEFDDNPTTVPSAPSGANVRLYTTDDGELYKKDAGDGTGDGNRIFTAQDFRRYPFYFTDFLGPNATNTADPTVAIWDTALTTSGTISGQPGTIDHPGWYNLLSSTSANSGVSINSNTTSLLLGGGEVFETIFQVVPASGTSVDIKFGFIDSAAAGIAVDGSYIYFSNSLTPSCVSVVGGVGETSTAFSAPITNATWYRALVYTNADATTVSCAIFTDGSDTPIETVTISTEADIPNGTGQETGSGFVALTTAATTAAIQARVDWISLYYTRRLTR